MISVAAAPSIATTISVTSDAAQPKPAVAAVVTPSPSMSRGPQDYDCEDSEAPEDTHGDGDRQPVRPLMDLRGGGLRFDDPELTRLGIRPNKVEVELPIRHCSPTSHLHIAGAP